MLGGDGLQARARLYADDVLKNLRSLETLLSSIDLYEKGTGARLNKSTTEAMWLEDWRSRSDEPLGLTWVKKMKVLGVFFGTVPVELDNRMPKINKLEKALNLWRDICLKCSPPTGHVSQAGRPFVPHLPAVTICN